MRGRNTKRLTIDTEASALSHISFIWIFWIIPDDGKAVFVPKFQCQPNHLRFASTSSLLLVETAPNVSVVLCRCKRTIEIQTVASNVKIGTAFFVSCGEADICALVKIRVTCVIAGDDSR
jgi:hypothetical protein